MGATSEPQQRLCNSDLKLPKQGYGQQSQQQAVEQEEDIFFLVSLDLDRKNLQEGSMNSPFLLYVTQGSSQTYKSNFYSEELTVQYLKRKSLGTQPPPSSLTRSLCV